MKKILIGLGSVALIATPLVAVISCSSNGGESKLTQLKINAKAIKQNIIDEVITKLGAENINDETKIAELSKIFVGITSENITLFTYNFENKVIYLNPSTGYSFNGVDNTPLRSVVELNIKNQNQPFKYSLVERAFKDFKDASTDELRAEALNRVFQNVEANSVSLLGVNFNQGVITLVVQETQATFENGLTELKNELIPADILNIKAIATTQVNIDKAIENWNSAASDKTAKVKALENIFSGIDESNIDKFTLTATSSPKVIILTTNIDSTFGTVRGDSINSKIIVEPTAS
ncbi:MAG: hypothetical protein ACRCRZ_02545 [Metamycoplasmataceae bacterium]